jgi:hypothetical protein
MTWKSTAGLQAIGPNNQKIGGMPANGPPTVGGWSMTSTPSLSAAKNQADRVSCPFSRPGTREKPADIHGAAYAVTRVCGNEPSLLDRVRAHAALGAAQRLRRRGARSICGGGRIKSPEQIVRVRALLVLWHGLDLASSASAM